MRAEIICVGTELLLGDIVNTNAQYVARELSALSISVYNQQVVGDNPQRLHQAAALAKERSDIVIYTGGLGPTDDDLTKQTIARLYNDTLVENRQVLRGIQAYFDKSGKQMTPNNKKQALVPQRGRYIENHFGTAPGIIFIDGEKMAILMPGVPREMEKMMSNQVVPLLKRLINGVILSRHVRLIGLGESELENKIISLLDAENPTMALYAKNGEVEVRITAKAKDADTANQMLDSRYAQLDSMVHNYIYGVDVDNIETVLVHQLMERGQTVSTAESCTGGNLSARITSVSGASSVFGLGVCTYSEEQKHKVLGVDLEDLENFTAVSSPVVIQMVQGALRNSGADYAIATTGYAGPGGGTPQEPVGTVYIAVANKDNIFVKKCFFSGDRQRIVHLACQSAFDLLRCVMNGLPCRGVRVVDNFIPEEEPPKQKKKSGKGFKLSSLLLVAVMALAVVFGTQKFKHSDGSSESPLPHINLTAITSGITGLFAKDVDVATTIENRLSTDFFSRGFERKTMKMFNRLCVQNPNIKGWLTFKSARLEYPVTDSRATADLDCEVYYMPDASIEDYHFIGGFTKGNSFDFTDLNTVRANSTFVLFDGDGYTDYRIFSVGTFSADELAQFAEISDKQEFIVQARARSLFDVDLMVTDSSNVVVLLQQMEEGHFVAVFAVPCDRNIFPSVDIKTMTMYADWYVEQTGVSNEFAYDALNYAQEIYDRDSWTLTNLGSQTVVMPSALPISSQAPSSGEVSASPSPSASSSPTRTVAPTPAATIDPTRSAVPTQTPETTQTPRPTQQATATPEPTARPTEAPTARPTQTPAPTLRPTPEETGEEILTVNMNGTVVSGPATQIISQIVSIEMSPSWNPEAIKAQAVAAHTYLEYQYNLGLQAPSVAGRTTPDRRVVNAVSQVSDVIITSGGRPINAVYTASAAGRTNPAREVWSADYAYLQSVESKYDYLSTGYEKKYTISAADMKNVLDSYLGTDLDMSDPGSWIEILNYTDGGYVRHMRIGNLTTYRGGSRTITGYYFANDIMYGEFGGGTMRSAAFDMSYADGVFTFTTHGYGHGVGLSQWGAQLYAQYEGWNYAQILTHYYTNVQLTKIS